MKGLPRSLSPVIKIGSGLLAVIGIAAIVVVLGANLGIGFATELVGAAIKPATTADAHEVEKVLPTHGVMYSTPERIVNLADKGTLRYLKALVVVELAKPGESSEIDLSSEAYKEKAEELKGEMVSRSVIIEDQITMILSSKTAAEMVTPEGKVKLKEELKSKLDELVGEHKVLNVYFTQFIIQ